MVHATQGNQGDASPRHVEDGRQSAELALDAPNIARVYDCLLGGKDNYEADRQYACELLKALPEAGRFARENRSFLARAIDYLAGEAKIDQFIDIGAGLPTSDNTHQVAMDVNPSARVVYVDHDPLVITHGRALLADNDQTAMVAADLRDCEAIVDHPDTRGLIDFARPVGVLFASVLHFVADDEAAAVTGFWRRSLRPGSHLVISHGEDKPQVAQAAELYRKRMNAGSPRSATQIAALFHGFDLVPPGLVPLPLWRPATSLLAGDAETMPLLGGVARRAAR